MSRATRFAVVGLLLTMLSACATRTAPVIPNVPPQFPDFVFPAIPAQFGNSPAGAAHSTAWRYLQAGDLRNAERGFSTALTNAPGFSDQAGIQPLPGNLDEAIGLMEESEFVAETLGEHVFDFFLRNKRQEWAGYRRQVTQYELDSLLPVV